MTSLREAYESGGGDRRLYAGVALFAAGAVLLVAGIALAATEVGARLGWSVFDAREAAGVLAGVGLPAVLLGTMAVLPRAPMDVRIAAVGGAVVSLAGVGVFYHAYPVDWIGGSGNTSMTAVAVGVYFLGAIVTCWCLFAAVANFKARNDPGGTVKLEITEGGETRIVEVSDERLRGRLDGIGGIGVFGNSPDGNVETQTNRSTDSEAADGTTLEDDAVVMGDESETPGNRSDTGSTRADSGSERRGTEAERRQRSNRTGGRNTDGFGSNQSVADGGATAGEDIEILGDEPDVVGDPYCGNCAHFRYVRTDDGMEPYCGHHGEVMDDMDACEEWTAN
ncbi:MAG: hypothetical protein PPP58_08145 [Natronomonas sp.]